MMNTRVNRALRKLAASGNAPKSPGFLDSFQNWTSSLFDGKQGTSMPHFNRMMNSEGMQNFGKSFDAFADNAGRFVDSFSDNTKGSTWNSFKNMYKGDGAPWAWGVTAATAATMASAFNNPANRTYGGGGGSGSGFWGALPWLGLGALGMYAYNQWPKWKNTYHELQTLSNGTTEDRAKQLQEYSRNPEAKRRAESGVKLLGTQKQLNDFRVMNNVNPMMQRADDTVKNVAMPNSWKRGFTSNNEVVQRTTDPTVYANAQKAHDRITGLGYATGNPVNATAQLDNQSLSMDAKNLDNRAVEELTMLMATKLNREAFNKQYRSIVERNNRRAKGEVTNSTTGGQVRLTKQKPVGWREILL